MSGDERAALIARLRASHRQLRHTRLDDAADLIESDGKRLAVAEKTIAAIGEAWRNLELPYQPVGNLLTEYDAAKEKL